MRRQGLWSYSTCVNAQTANCAAPKFTAANTSSLIAVLRCLGQKIAAATVLRPTFSRSARLCIDGCEAVRVKYAPSDIVRTLINAINSYRTGVLGLQKETHTSLD